MTTRLTRCTLGLVLVVSLAASVTAVTSGQGAAPAPPEIPRSPQGTPDLSGYWELRFDSRNVPSAKLVASLSAATRAAQSEKDAHAMRWCNWLGTPFAMTDYRPLDIRQGAREVAIIFEMQNAIARHIYLNRAPFDPEEIDSSGHSTNGVSVGRWQGDVLVAETFGWADDRGVTAIPGGGFRTSSSKLTERFRLIDGGQILSVVSTWTDPKVFAAPHTYEYRYYRAPKEYEGRRIACAPGNVQERTRFMTEPPLILPGPGR